MPRQAFFHIISKLFYIIQKKPSGITGWFMKFINIIFLNLTSQLMHGKLQYPSSEDMQVSYVSDLPS